MPAILPLVDQFGNINVHPREHLSVAIGGGEGVGPDLSGKTYFFEILDPAGRALIRVPVNAHPAQPTKKLVFVDRDVLSKKLPAAGAAFVLLDETGGSSKVRWEGYIKRRAL